MNIRLLIFILMQCTSAWAIAQESIPHTAIKALGLHPGRQESPKATRQLLLTPFFLPGYSPDIQFTLTAGGIFSFKTEKGDSKLPISTLPVTVTYSSTGAFVTSANLVTYWLHDRLRVNCLLQYRSLNDVYFGVGYKNALETAYPDSTGYHRSYFVFQLRPLWRLARYLFAGPTLDYNQNILWKINPHMAKDPNYLEFGQFILNAGLGGTINYDSRDFPQNAYSGIYISTAYSIYSHMLGANTHFWALDIDCRAYLPLSRRKIRTLAINWRSRYEFGATPFTAMPSFGSPFDLRGYRYGQFRDRYSNYAIVEYRHKIYLLSLKPSRYGFVLWGGIGTMGRNFSQSIAGRVLPNGGIGFWDRDPTAPQRTVGPWLFALPLGRVRQFSGGILNHHQSALVY